MRMATRTNGNRAHPLTVYLVCHASDGMQDIRSPDRFCKLPNRIVGRDQQSKGCSKFTIYQECPIGEITEKRCCENGLAIGTSCFESRDQVVRHVNLT